MSFLARLPAQHQVRKYTKQVAIQVLDDDSRMASSTDSPVAALREYCAALLWLNANNPVQLPSLENLSAAERRTLCVMLGLSDFGVPGVVRRRILACVSGPDPAASAQIAVGFYSFMLPTHPELDGDTASLKTLAQQSSFQGRPSTRREAQEEAAMHFWCLDVLQQDDDVRALPLSLRTRLERAHGIPMSWPESFRASTVVGLVKAWISRTSHSHVSLQARAQPPSPTLGPPAATHSLPPPAYVHPVQSADQSQLGSGSLHNTQIFGNNLSAAALTQSFQNLSISMQSLCGPQSNPLAVAHFQVAPSPARTQLDWIRDEGEKKLLRLRFLYCHVTSLVSAAERNDLLDSNKVNTMFSTSSASATGSKIIPNCPYADFPWQQPLVLSPGYGAAAQGKMCQIALRCDTAQFTDAQEKMVRDKRIETEQELVNEFERAFAAHSISDCLVQVDSIRRFIIEQMRVISVSATSDAGRFPQPEFGLLAYARKMQYDQMSLFLTAVSEQIVTLSAGRDNRRAEVGMWKQFVDGWHVSAQAGVQREAALALTVGFAPSASKTQAAGVYESEPEVDEPTPRSAPRSKADKRSEQQKLAQKDKATAPYFPASSSIIGDALGLAPPAGKCRHCQTVGHFHSECPVRWGQRGHPLPGFNSSGRRKRSAWENDNPTKETFAAWVKFWKDKSIYANEPAVRDGAPDLTALKKASRDGPPP